MQEPQALPIAFWKLYHPIILNRTEIYITSNITKFEQLNAVSWLSLLD